MTFNRIHQAISERNWDLVVELAEKAKQEDQSSKLKEALADPAEISIKTTGRNGQEVIYNFPIQTWERAEAVYSYNTEPEYDSWVDFGPVIRSIRRKVNINIRIEPK